MDLLDRLRLDHPVAQAGMSHMAPPTLAAAVARAGGLGTIGTCAPSAMAAGIDQVRQEAPGRAVAVNLLMPFVTSHHVEACIAHQIDVAVVAFGGDAELIERLRDAGITVFVMVHRATGTHSAGRVGSRRSDRPGRRGWWSSHWTAAGPRILTDCTCHRHKQPPGVARRRNRRWCRHQGGPRRRRGGRRGGHPLPVDA